MNDDFWNNIAMSVNWYLRDYKGNRKNLDFTEDRLITIMKRIYDMGYQRGQLSKEWL